VKRAIRPFEGGRADGVSAFQAAGGGKTVPALRKDIVSTCVEKDQVIPRFLHDLYQTPHTMVSCRLIGRFSESLSSIGQSGGPRKKKHADGWFAVVRYPGQGSSIGGIG
jgi:hypothetical protein